MDIREFLGRLQNVTGPNGKGEYMCRCPAHDDKTASLSVTEKESRKDGKRRIYFCCQTRKCSTQDVLDAMGLKASDLISDPGADQRTVPGMTVRTVKRKLAKDKTWPSYEAAYGYLGKYVCSYVYQDAAGKPLFEVARIDTSKGGKREKTFRQHILTGPG